MDNILSDIPWMLIEGHEPMTPKEVLSQAESIELARDIKGSDLPGFIYGAQLRFLMTIMPLLYKLNPNNPFDEENVAEIIHQLSPAARLFDADNPFLQVANKGDEKFHPPGKLYPTGASKEQINFWLRDALDRSTMDIAEATRALVTAYFYMPGTNTALGGKKLANGSSALRYSPEEKLTEIIALGNSLGDQLLFNTPKSFLKESNSGQLLPHWADCAGDQSRGDVAGTPLWNFSWSSNTFCCQWEREKGLLTGVVRGGIPDQWNCLIPISSDDKWGKAFHDARAVEDPLYFYLYKGDDELKLYYPRLASEPYYTVAQWNAENLSLQLAAKWQKMLKDPGSNGLENILFLSHETGGTAQSFSIRSSEIIIGWRDELMPEGNIDKISDYCNSLLKMNKRLNGFFTSKGTCNHLEARQKDINSAYWREIRPLVERIFAEELAEEEVQEEIIRGALRAFEQVSDNRNTVYIDRHLKAMKIIRNNVFDLGVNK